MSNETKPNEDQPKTKRETLQAKRDALRADFEKLELAQEEIDLEKILELEIEYGVENVTVVKGLFVPGGVTRVAARTPKPEEIKRYRHRVKPKKLGEVPNAQEAAAELAAVCRIYPDAAAWEKVLAARPGVDTQLGQKAVALAVGEEETEGKD